MATRRLVIDTATEALSVALFEDGLLLAGHHQELGRGHAERLMPVIAGLPDGGHCREIWVNAGPGSFTGLRVGVAAARALAFAWGAALSGYSTHALVAAQARRHHGATGELCVAMTGGHGELFWQMFGGDGPAPLTPLRSTPVAAFAGTGGATSVYGSGAQALVAARGYGDAVPMLPDARETGLLPPGSLIEPVAMIYVRGADARPAGDARR